MTNIGEDGKPMLYFPTMKDEDTGSNGFRETKNNTKKQLNFPSMTEKDETLLDGRTYPAETS